MHPDFNRRPMPSESAVFCLGSGASVWYFCLLLSGFGRAAAAGAEGHVGAFLRLLQNETRGGFGFLVPAHVGKTALDGGLPGVIFLAGTEEAFDAVDDLGNCLGGRLGGELDYFDFNAEQDPLGALGHFGRFILHVEDLVDLASGAGNAEIAIHGLGGAQGHGYLLLDFNFALVHDREAEFFLGHPHPQVV